jgi:hypothetical protein
MFAEPPAGESLSSEEVEQLIILLARYVTHDLDQWENWRIETPYDEPVFVEITRARPPGHPAEAFRTVWARGRPRTPES